MACRHTSHTFPFHADCFSKPTGTLSAFRWTLSKCCACGRPDLQRESSSAAASRSSQECHECGTILPLAVALRRPPDGSCTTALRGGSQHPSPAALEGEVHWQQCRSVFIKEIYSQPQRVQVRTQVNTVRCIHLQDGGFNAYKPLTLCPEVLLQAHQINESKIFTYALYTYISICIHISQKY
jgi:hypothetical protein